MERGLGKWLFIFFLGAVPAFSISDSDFHICFFELNNPTASLNLKGQNLPPGTKIHVFNTTTKSQNQIAAFKAMIESNKKCDSLVISGHHTGNWFGDNKRLNLKDLEALACDTKYKNWFSNIKALWLDGCNTVTDNSVLKASPPSPDSETVRVAAKERENSPIEKALVHSLSQSYSLSLDKNTPLSSRYLRIFPETKIYGFNGPAPLGETKKNQTGGRSFIAEHLSHLGQALQAEDDSAKEATQKDPIQQGLKAIFSQEDCEEQIEAWEKVGKTHGLQTEAIENLKYEKAQRLGCDLILAKQLLDNPNSKEAQQALANKIKKSGYRGGGVLNLANNILKDKNSKESAIKLAKKLINRSLDEINKDDSAFGREDQNLSLSHLLFSNIYDTWQTAKNYQTQDSQFFKDVQGKLQTDKIENSLWGRIRSAQTSSLRKADYIKFYTELHPKKNRKEIKGEITKLVAKSKGLFKGLKSPSQSQLPEKSRRALALSIADQLLQYDLLSDQQKKELLNSDLFSQTEDPFTLNTLMHFKVAGGADSLEALLEDSPPNSSHKRAAVQALTRHYINKQPESLDNLIVELREDKSLNSLLNTMHQELSYKNPQERIAFLSSRINTSKNLFTRNLLSIYSNYEEALNPEEKKQLCDQVLEQRFKEKIRCP